MQSRVVREVANIPGDQVILTCVALGWPDEEFIANSVRSRRLPVDDLTRFLGFPDDAAPKWRIGWADVPARACVAYAEHDLILISGEITLALIGWDTMGFQMLRTALVAALMITMSATAHAVDLTRELSWDDLVPKGAPIVDPLEDISMDVREDLGFIARIKMDLRQGFISEDSEEYRNALDLQEKHAADGVDIEAIMAELDALDAEIERRGNDVVTDLEGLLVRLPGYALPLEQSAEGVSELLLVPYVGACIHVPAPPANQMVFVELREAYDVNSLYDPVWVTGRLTVEPASRSLSFVDGQAPVATGYTLTGVTIEPYQ